MKDCNACETEKEVSGVLLAYLLWPFQLKAEFKSSSGPQT